MCPGLFLNKVAGWKPATSSNRDSGAGAFLWVLRNSWEELFYKHLGTAASEDRISFRNASGFYNEQNKQIYMSSKIPERLNKFNFWK